MLINVNFPDCPRRRGRGLRVTSQGKRKIGDTLLERIDPRGEPYVWIGGLRSDDVQQAGTDLQAVAANHISVTPVHMDMTHRPSFERLRLASEVELSPPEPHPPTSCKASGNALASQVLVLICNFNRPVI